MILRVKRNQAIQFLKDESYKPVKGLSNLFINQHGKVYHLKTCRYLTPNFRNNILFDKKYYDVAKLVLQTFAKEQYRRGQITHIDGNNKNNSIENVKYSRMFAPDQLTEVNPNDLITAIRCYFEIPEKFKITNFVMYWIYLNWIINKRLFLHRNKQLEYIEVFKTYSEVKNIKETAKRHNIGVKDCTAITRKVLYTLITEILTDLQNGLLTIKEYSPKRPTATEQIKKTNQQLKEYGLTVFLPLRKKSIKSKLKDYHKTTNQINEL